MTIHRLLSGAIAALIAVTLVSGSAVAAPQSKPAAKTAPAKPASTAKPAAALIDLNSASKAELMTLPGIGDALSQKIMDARPFARKDELVIKKIIPQSTYDKIKDQVVARQKK